METPSSTTRRVTRSQTLPTSANTNNIPMSRKIEESEKGISKSRQRTEKKQQDRSVLIDITNDSPIVGLAMGSLNTPLSSTLSKKKNKINTTTNTTKTPGSGEALLRGQVKTLLQKVEEEAELSKLSLENRPFLHLINSPATLLAPTPANTPHVLNLSETSFKNTCLASVTPSPVQEQFKISQMVAEIFDGKKQQEEGSSESEKSMITRSLIWDFSEKSEGYDSSACSSVLTNEGGIIGGEIQGKEKSSSTDDDDEASVWSIQVNASSTRDDEEEEDYEDGIEEFGEDDDYEEGEEEEEEDGGLVDALCEGMSKVSVNGEKAAMPEFTGRHTRFVYNSDDEIEGEEECGAENGDAATLGILRLKGLPTPKGKHLRFPPMEEEEDN